MFFAQLLYFKIYFYYQKKTLNALFDTCKRRTQICFNKFTTKMHDAYSKNLVKKKQKEMSLMSNTKRKGGKEPDDIPATITTQRLLCQYDLIHCKKIEWKPKANHFLIRIKGFKEFSINTNYLKSSEESRHAIVTKTAKFDKVERPETNPCRLTVMSDLTTNRALENFGNGWEFGNNSRLNSFYHLWR